MANAQEVTPEYIPPQEFHPTDIPSILWAYPLISLLLMGINLFFMVHALKTGRPYYWVWILFAMPFIGALAYFFVEMRPRMGRINWKQIQWQFASPKARVAFLDEIVGGSPTVTNRCRLAAELEQHERWDDAIKQYRECLNGVFADDPRLRILLANALLNQGSVQEANDIILLVGVQRDAQLEEDRKMIVLRCKSELGDHEVAIDGMAQLATKTYSLAPRYYLAHAKQVAGRHEEALADAQAILQAYRRGNALFRRSEQEWFRKAKWLINKRD